MNLQRPRDPGTPAGAASTSNRPAPPGRRGTWWRGASWALLLAVAALTLLDLGCGWRLCSRPRFTWEITLGNLGTGGPPSPFRATITNRFHPFFCGGASLAEWDAFVAQRLSDICAGSAGSAADRLLFCEGRQWCKVSSAMVTRAGGMTTCDAPACAADGRTPPIPPLPDCPPVPPPPEEPRLVVDPTSVDFGTVPLGTTSPPQAIQVTNGGGGRLVVVPPADRDIMDAMMRRSFLLDPIWACASLTPEEIAAGGAFLGSGFRPSCQVSVRLQPTVRGPLAATLRISATNGSVPMVQVMLGGTGAADRLRLGGSVLGPAGRCPDVASPADAIRVCFDTARTVPDAGCRRRTLAFSTTTGAVQILGTNPMPAFPRNGFFDLTAVPFPWTVNPGAPFNMTVRACTVPSTMSFLFNTNDACTAYPFTFDSSPGCTGL